MEPKEFLISKACEFTEVYLDSERKKLDPSLKLNPGRYTIKSNAIFNEEGRLIADFNEEREKECSSLWNLVDEWNKSESHERHICAEQLSKALIKERLKKWEDEIGEISPNKVCAFGYSGDASDLGINPYGHINFFKKQGN